MKKTGVCPSCGGKMIKVKQKTKIGRNPIVLEFSCLNNKCKQKFDVAFKWSTELLEGRK